MTHRLDMRDHHRRHAESLGTGSADDGQRAADRAQSARVHDDQRQIEIAGQIGVERRVA